MTKNELIAQFQANNTTITATINGEQILLNSTDYEKTMNDWVAMRLDQIKIENEIAQAQAAKEAAQDKLSALGLTTNDLKALGL
jgi:hypothetical protein